MPIGGQCYKDIAASAVLRATTVVHSLAVVAFDSQVGGVYLHGQLGKSLVFDVDSTYWRSAS